jgi:peptide/nickel transport system permease protein
VVIFGAGFFALYDVAAQNRDLPYAPPTRVHFVDHAGKLHARPFVCALGLRPGTFDSYVENTDQCAPIHFLTKGGQYRLFGIVQCSWHLLSVEPPVKLFLMGTDAYGRDMFSRFLYGGQVSLSAGLLATLLALVCGTMFGTFAGYFGGWIDAAVMRGAELFLALPWLYLLLSLRACLPLTLNSNQAFMLLIAVVGTVGWARPARLVRSVVLSSREQHYVLAARLFGGSHVYLIRRHILPDTYSVVITQAALLIPQYIIAEVTLSFLGLGVGEPTPSWGNMLSSVQQYSVLVSYWWMLIPGLALVPVFLGYMLLANELKPGSAAARV